MAQGGRTPPDPGFIDIVGPTKKWGGDNAGTPSTASPPVDPGRDLLRRGDASGTPSTLSLTVYGGPMTGTTRSGSWGASTAARRRRDRTGSSAWCCHPRTPGPGPGVDQAGARRRGHRTCDNLADPERDARAAWRISADDRPATFAEDDTAQARRFRAAQTWVRVPSAMVPLTAGGAQRHRSAFRSPPLTFRVGGRCDAAYAVGPTTSTTVRPWSLGEAGRPSASSGACVSECLLLHTYNYDYERVTINGTQVHYEPDGSWEIVIAPRDPGHPNWVSTAGHHRGWIWFRWFLPARTPEQPTSEVVATGSSG